MYLGDLILDLGDNIGDLIVELKLNWGSLMVESMDCLKLLFFAAILVFILIYYIQFDKN